VLTAYHILYPDLILGLSDHTPGHATVLGAVALGARVIEKHFTDDCHRTGPDHPFSLEPESWEKMVVNTRQLEQALGSAEKYVTDNEHDTVIIQRRCLRAARAIRSGEVITRDMVNVLRPATPGAIPPYEIGGVIGKRAAVDLASGQELCWTSIIE
jgi:N-acetylneuraminate synthase